MRLGYLLTGGDEAEAEDLLQEVFVVLARRGIADLEHPMAYARTAMTNRFRDRLRSESSRRRAFTRAVDVDPHQDDTATITDREALVAALRRLSPRERTVIVLRYYEDQDDRTIADILGCRQATVRSLAHRALPKLRLDLEEIR